MKARWAFFPAVAALVAHVTPALADGADDVQSLLSESVVTTASTTAEKASSAPATSVTLTSEDLRRYGFRSIAEAINFLSLGVITSDGLRTPDIGSRGVLLAQDDGKHFLLLVNGHAVNDPLYGAARFDQGAGIPFDLIDRIEVIVGPGSVLYGSNAMLGVINVITKSASEYRGGHVLGEYEPGRSWTGGAGAGFTFDLFGAKSEITLGAEHYERFGPDLDFETQEVPVEISIGERFSFRRGAPADGIWGGKLREAYFTKASSGTLRLRSGDFDVMLQANVYRRGIPYTTTGIDIDFDDPDSYELDRAVRVDIKHQATLSSLVQLTSRVYADGFDFRRKANRNALAGCFRADIATCTYFDVGVARWLGIEERVSFNWLEDLSLVTLFGIDARERWVSAKQDAYDFDTGRAFAPSVGQIGDGTDESAIVSPYLQQTWSPLAWLDLNAGARLDIDERFDPVVSPRGAVAIRPYRTTTLRGIYSQAFRAPTWSETDFATYRVAPADGIEPEIARSVEVSLEQRFSTHRLMFGVFRTWWENLIASRLLTLDEMSELQRQGRLPITSNGLARFENEASIKNYGWNGSLDGSFAGGKLAYGVNVTAAYTRHSETQDLSAGLLDVAPQLFGNARLAYAFDGYIPSPALAASFVNDRPAHRAFETRFNPIPYTRALGEFRFTLTGKVPALTGLGYRASAAVSTSSENAYAVGPAANYNTIDPAYAPIDQFRFFVGLRYDFGAGEQPSTSEE